MLICISTATKFQLGPPRVCDSSTNNTRKFTLQAASVPMAPCAALRAQVAILNTLLKKGDNQNPNLWGQKLLRDFKKYCLVVYLPLWKIWKSIGIIIPNIYGKTKNVPNHQPGSSTKPRFQDVQIHIIVEKEQHIILDVIYNPQGSSFYSGHIGRIWYI